MRPYCTLSGRRSDAVSPPMRALLHRTAIWRGGMSACDELIRRSAAHEARAQPRRSAQRSASAAMESSCSKDIREIQIAPTLPLQCTRAPPTASTVIQAGRQNSYSTSTCAFCIRRAAQPDPRMHAERPAASRARTPHNKHAPRPPPGSPCSHVTRRAAARLGSHELTWLTVSRTIM